jgi:hypothetical protein
MVWTHKVTPTIRALWSRSAAREVYTAKASRISSILVTDYADQLALYHPESAQRLFHGKRYW